MQIGESFSERLSAIERDEPLFAKRNGVTKLRKRINCDVVFPGISASGFLLISFLRVVVDRYHSTINFLFCFRVRRQL